MQEVRPIVGMMAAFVALGAGCTKKVDVTGSVTDPMNTGTGVAEVTVKVEPAHGAASDTSVTTGKDGAFSIPKLAAGARYKLTATRGGFTTATAEFEVGKDGAFKAPSLHISPSARVRGRVFDPLKNEPIAEVSVTAQTASDLVEAEPYLKLTTTTGTDGFYEFESILAKERYDLAFTKDGYTRAAALLRMPEAGQTRKLLDVNMNRLPSVTGRVEHRLSGRGLPGCSVSIGDPTTTTDANGAFELAGVPVGNYRVLARCGEATGTADVEVTTGQPSFALDGPMQVIAVPPSPSGLWVVERETLTAIDNSMDLPSTLNVRQRFPLLELHKAAPDMYWVSSDTVEAAAENAPTIKRGAKLVFRKPSNDVSSLTAFPVTRLEAKEYPSWYRDGSGPPGAKIEAGHYIRLVRVDYEEGRNNYGIGERASHARFEQQSMWGREVIATPSGKLSAGEVNWPPGLYCLTFCEDRAYVASDGCQLVRVTGSAAGE